MITALDTVLTVLHDRGILNEIAFEEVCAELLDDQPITRAQLVRIFGDGPIFDLLTKDGAMTITRTDLLVREAAPALYKALQTTTTALELAVRANVSRDLYDSDADYERAIGSHVAIADARAALAKAEGRCR